MADKYLSSGERIKEIGILEDGRVVYSPYRITYDYEGNETEFLNEEDVRIAHPESIYDKPPHSVLEESISKLKARRTELQKELSNLNISMSNARSEYTKFLKDLQQYEPLKDIKEFLDGKITHLVIDNGWRYEIIDVKGAIYDEYFASSSKGELRLLSLWGSKQREFRWRLNQYPDGTGHDVNAIPCLSFEEAKEKLQQIINKLLRDWTNSSSTREWIVKAAKQYDLSVPQKMIDAYEKEKEESQRQQIKRAEAAYEVAKDNLETAKRLLDKAKE
jgi:hypothetical protein